MSLEDKLAAMREGAAKRMPAPLQAITHEATVRLQGFGIWDRVLRPGASAPDFALND